jgi:hypothetical protein
MYLNFFSVLILANFDKIKTHFYGRRKYILCSIYYIMYITHYGMEVLVLIINMMKETLATGTFVIQNLNFHIYRVIQLLRRDITHFLQSSNYEALLM